MATALQTASGRLMRVQGPRLGQYSSVTGGYAMGAVWTNGEGPEGSLVDDFSAMSYLAVVLSQPMVAAVANKIVRTVASRPLKVYRLNSQNDRVRITSASRDSAASLVGVLERPQPRRSGVHLKQWIMSPSTIFGNSVVAKYRSDPNGPPDALLPLRWTQLSGYAEMGGDVEWWGSTQLGGAERYVRVEDTLHFAWDAPESGVGISPLEQLARTIRLEDAAVRSQTATFRNGSRPGGWVSMPPGTKTDKESWDRMRSSIETLHKGVDQHGRIGLLAPGATFSPASFSPVDLDLMKARVYNREEACMSYDVKPPVIGADLSGLNYAGLREIYKDFHVTSMRPWYSLIEETIQAQLIDPEPMWEGCFVEFELADVLRGDPLQEAEALERQINSAGLTPNESRRIRNLPVVDDEAADKLYISQNTRPLDEPLDQPDTQPAADEPAPPQAPQQGPGAQVIRVIRDGNGNITGYEKAAG